MQGSDCSILGNVTRICCSVPVFLSFFHPIPPAFHWICCSTFDCNGICESREGCIRSKGLIESLGEKLFNFLLSSLGFLCFFHPTPCTLLFSIGFLCFFHHNPLRFIEFVATLSIMLQWDLWVKTSCMCNKGLIWVVEGNGYSTS